MKEKARRKLSGGLRGPSTRRQKWSTSQSESFARQPERGRDAEGALTVLCYVCRGETPKKLGGLSIGIPTLLPNWIFMGL